MSLKNFHLAFIVASTLLTLFCAVEAFGAFRAEGSPLMAAASALALAIAVFLIRFEARFMRQCREAGIR